MPNVLKIALPAAAAGALAAAAALFAPGFVGGDATRAQATATSSSVATDGAVFSEPERAEIGAIVREYLLANPDVMREVFVALENQEVAAREVQQRLAVVNAGDALFRAGHDVVMGNPEGDVTLVEFFDYNCGFCKRALGDVMKMVETDPNLRVVLKDFPVLGEDSAAAAQIAVAATRQMTPEQEVAFHRELMETRGRIGGQQALRVAERMGLDMERLAAESESREVLDILNGNMQLADRLGLTGTPAWVVGDGVIFGAVGEARLSQAVANARECGSPSC